MVRCWVVMKSFMIMFGKIVAVYRFSKKCILRFILRDPSSQADATFPVAAFLKPGGRLREAHVVHVRRYTAGVALS